jgi:hypothetical protein
VVSMVILSVGYPPVKCLERTLSTMLSTSKVTGPGAGRAQCT